MSISKNMTYGLAGNIHTHTHTHTFEFLSLSTNQKIIIIYQIYENNSIVNKIVVS